MGITLSKGQKVDLTKGNPGLKNILVGLGWDTNKYDGGFDFDLDTAAFLTGASGSVTNDGDFVFYNNLKHTSGAVEHLGDNRTGEGDGDDEQILVNLDKVPSNIHKLLFVVNIYNCVDRKQHFGMIENAYIRVEDQGNKKEIAKYNLSDNYSEKTTLIVGAIYRKDGSWQFKAIGEGTKDAGLKEVMQNLDRIECAYGI